MANRSSSSRAEIISTHLTYALVRYTALFTYLDGSTSSCVGRKIIESAEFIQTRATNIDLCACFNKATSASFMFTMERQIYSRLARQPTIKLPLSVGF